MVSFTTNSVNQLFQTYEKSNEINNQLPINICNMRHKGKQLVNNDEPLIDANEEPAGPDPLLIDETGQLSNQWILLDCNAPKQTRKCKKKFLKDPERMKMLSKLPIKNMVYEAFKVVRNIRGIRTRDIKKFIATKYGVEFEAAQIMKVIEMEKKNGHIKQIRRSNTRQPIGRYKLSNFQYSRVKREAQKTEDCESLKKSTSINVEKADIVTDEMHTDESLKSDDIKKSSGESVGIQMTGSSLLVAEDTAKLKLDSIVDKKSVDVPSLESRTKRTECERPNTRGIIGQYKLTRSYIPRVKKGKEQTGHCKSSKKSINFDVQNADMVTGRIHTDESLKHDYITKSIREFGGIQMINSSFSVVKKPAKMKLNLSVVDKKSVDVSGLDFRLQKADLDAIHTDEIDFMVLHSLHCSPDPNGMRLDEIAEFIHSFYDIDAQKSLPYIKEYLNYNIEKGIFFKNGDKYKKTFATWNFKSQKYSRAWIKRSEAKWPMEDSIDVDNELGTDESIFSDSGFLLNVKLEPGEMVNSSGSELVSNSDGIEMNINNNSIESIDKKRDGANVTKNKRNSQSNNDSLKTGAATSKIMETELPRNTTGQLENTNTALSQYIKVEEQFDIKRVKTIEQPFVSFMRGQVIPFLSERVKTPVKKHKGSKNVMQQLKDSFQTLNCRHQSLNDLRFKERDLPHVQEVSHKHKVTPGFNQIEENKSKFNFPVAFNEPKYNLVEISAYVSRYSMTLSIPATDLLWEEIEIRKNFSCLKLTGTNSSSNKNLNCKICGDELKFGPLKCNVCFFELESNVEKCNICHLLCNRGDVFHKHFLWEHRPLIQEIDDDSTSVVEEKIGSLLNKLANNNLFRCTLCMFLTNTIETFESHMVGNHTSRINVFPPLPEVAVRGEVFIFQKEIANTCCHQCNECGFISNKRDFMVYHILDVHVSIGNEIDDELFLNTEVEPKKKKRPRPGEVKWSFGQCHICGNFYNNVAHHLDRHLPIYDSIQLDANANQSSQNQDKTQPNTNQQLLLSANGISNKPRRRRRKPNPNRVLLCHICGKVIKRNLNAHLRIHGQVMYDCTICGRQFNRQSNLLTHRRVHTREKPFQCDICQMMFGYKCSIKGHIENVHSETVR